MHGDLQTFFCSCWMLWVGGSCSAFMQVAMRAELKQMDFKVTKLINALQELVSSAWGQGAGGYSKGAQSC